MAINFFVYALLAFSAVFAAISIESVDNKDKKEEKPQIVFEKSTLYTMNNDNIDRIVNSSRVMRFKDRDIMYNGKIILRTNNEATDFIEADVIIKRGDLFKFLTNVRYNRENDIILNTEELFYDSKKKIATNSVDYSGLYYNHTVEGNSLNVDLNKSIIKSNDTHFEILLNN